MAKASYTARKITLPYKPPRPYFISNLARRGAEDCGEYRQAAGAADQMTIEDRRGAAYHEAGHIVVAWSFGLEVGAAAIGINGDDAKGASEIGSAEELRLVDRIALCAAGLVSQNVFRAPTHERVAAMDEARIIELTKSYDEDTRLGFRDAGYRRAHDLIKAHGAKVDQVAKKLLAAGSLSQTEVRAYLELL